MAEFYPKKNNVSTDGPSELTIKRILAFSKAMGASKKRAEELVKRQKKTS